MLQGLLVKVSGLNMESRKNRLRRWLYMQDVGECRVDLRHVKEKRRRKEMLM
jgi:hypothetical protein